MSVGVHHFLKINPFFAGGKNPTTPQRNKILLTRNIQNAKIEGNELRARCVLTNQICTKGSRFGNITLGGRVFKAC